MVIKEPTLFYLLSKHPPKLALPTQDSKFKSTIAFTIAIILEYSHIQKIPTALEKPDQRSAKDSSTLMSHFIG